MSSLLLSALLSQSDPDGDEADGTPGSLAQRLDRMNVQTPALRIVDQELVAIAERVRVMLQRREVFASAVRRGIGEQDALQQAEQQVTDAGNGNLILSMPPQEGKTTAIGRYGLLWLLRKFPGLRVGIVSYDGDHAARISYMARGDIELFDGSGGNYDLGLRLAKDQKAMSRWLLAAPHGGGVYAIGIGGGLTGRPVDVLLIDDPVKDIRAADSIIQSGDAWEWWQTVARPRLAPWAPVILVATRWHEADLSGRLITKQAEDEAAGAPHYDKWRVVNIPAQADHNPAEGEVDILGREPGEYMISARGRTEAQWEATKASTAARFWSALYQGRPTPGVGDVWLKAWWRKYFAPMWSQQPDGTFRVPGVDKVLQSWDMAFKDTKASDYVVGQVWAVRGAESFLITQVWARLSFTDTLTAFQRLTRLFPQAHEKIVEDKANGTAVIDSLKAKIPGIIPAMPTQSKEARAVAVSPFIEAGNVHLPSTTVAVMHPDISWDPEAYVEEATSFPNGAHDDQVDATSQALARIYLGPGGEMTVGTAQGQLPRGAQTATTGVPRGSQPSRLPAHQRRLIQKQLR